MFSGLEIIILVLLKKRKSLCLETLDPNGSHTSRKKYEPPYHVKVLMLSLVHSLRFCFLWFGLPSVENGQVKRTFTKLSPNLQFFQKNDISLYLFGWMRTGDSDYLFFHYSSGLSACNRVHLHFV